MHNCQLPELPFLFKLCLDLKIYIEYRKVYLLRYKEKANNSGSDPKPARTNKPAAPAQTPMRLRTDECLGAGKIFGFVFLLRRVIR